jgi:hypothetical protein
MPFEVIGIGGSPNDDTGDTLRAGGVKINSNFSKAVEGPALSTDGRLALFDGADGKLLKVGTRLESELVAGPASATDGRVAVFDGIGGKVIKNGTKVEADLVVGPASTVNNNRMVVFDQTTGRLVKQAAFVENDVNRLGTAQTVTALKTHTQSVVIESDSARAFAIARSVNGTAASRVVVRKSRGSVGSETIVSNGDSLGFFDFEGYDGANYVLSASVRAAVSGTPGSSGDMPTALRFLTKPGSGAITERMRITPAGAVEFPSLSTTASAANAFLDSANNNNLLRSTSSIRYKTSVETLEREYADNVLALRPVWYRSLAEADRAEWSWYGLIAEEVAEVEPRLVHWTYPESAYEEVAVEGGEGAVERVLKADAELVPDGVQYERLAVLLLDVVQRQQVAIDELRAQVEELSGG